MDPILAPAKTYLSLEVVEHLAAHTVFEAELSVVGNGGFSHIWNTTKCAYFHLSARIDLVLV